MGPLITEATIDLLNQLIHVSMDGERGCRTAAEDVRNSQLPSVFIEYAMQRSTGETLAIVEKQCGKIKEAHASVLSEKYIA